MIQVKDGKVVQTKLPRNGRLSDGRTVSGYYKLPETILRKEGWLPEIEKKPEYDPAIERLVFDSYNILKDKVEKVYKAEPLPEPELSEVEILKQVLIEKQIISESDLTKEAATK